MTLAWPTPWRDQPTTPLSLLYRREGGRLWGAVLPAALDDGAGDASAAFTRHRNAAFDLDAPVQLDPVRIAKPWGAEYWFSGIEARGESGVRQGTASAPLSHYLALDPSSSCGARAPILLKRLAPLPDAERGDLYLETHDSKREVYVVTRIDPAAWPDGQGGVRFGVSQVKRQQFASDAAFRAAFLDAALAYRAVREVLDDDDPSRASSRTGVRAAAAAREPALRAALYEFTALRRLQIGDVVQVPPGMPHSLQHGVDVFEFQTPVYERNIIAFGQRVLTQPHWDSEYAIANLSLEPPPAAATDTQLDTGPLTVERIAVFDDFEVHRARLAQGEWTLPDGPGRILARIEGDLRLRWHGGALDCHAAALLLPASCAGATLSGNGIALFAAPR